MIEGYKRVWIEDECTRHSEDHVCVMRAYQKYLGKTCPQQKDWKLIKDGGDYFVYQTHEDIVVVHDYMGHEIWIKENT